LWQFVIILNFGELVANDLLMSQWWLYLVVGLGQDHHTYLKKVFFGTIHIIQIYMKSPLHKELKCFPMRLPLTTSAGSDL